jgi:iron complex outermembrane receptor protein
MGEELGFGRKTMKDITRFGLLIASSSVAYATPAWAQASNQSNTREVLTGNDIVVTARRSEERLQDVPISITVFNQQRLSERNVVNAGDLATYTPSLSANSNFGS